MTFFIEKWQFLTFANERAILTQLSSFSLNEFIYMMTPKPTKTTSCVYWQHCLPKRGH